VESKNVSEKKWKQADSCLFLSKKSGVKETQINKNKSTTTEKRTVQEISPTIDIQRSKAGTP
jgi:hypothetical protein